MRKLMVAITAVLLLAPIVAAAQDRDSCATGMVCASDPDTVMRAMDKAGFKPRKVVDNQGDPMIESDEAAYNFQVYFYGCEQHKHCDSLRFEVAFAKGAENTEALANKWNAGKRFLQASVRGDGRFAAAYDVATIGGVNERNFADVLDWWQSMLGELGDFFREELNSKESGEGA